VRRGVNRLPTPNPATDAIAPAATPTTTTRRSKAFSVRAQFIEQAPGPRGSPQLPHGAGAALRVGSFADSAPTANTESCLARSSLRQDGHASTVFSRTSNSN
jgi:hypothetical protein